MGLNNLRHTDYVNVVLHALSHVTPVRDFFLQPGDLLQPTPLHRYPPYPRELCVIPYPYLLQPALFDTTLLYPAVFQPAIPCQTLTYPLPLLLYPNLPPSYPSELCELQVSVGA